MTPDGRRLAGKSAIVTGAAGGIGRAVAETFASHGCRVVLADIEEERMLAVANEIRTRGGEATARVVDVSVRQEVSRLVSETVDDLGRLDIMVNNAGVRGGGLSHTLGTNLNGVLFGCRYATKAMAQTGGGSVVNTSSVMGLVGAGGPVDSGADVYVASKHAVIGLTREFALQYGRQGVRVNCVCPGWIETDLIDNFLADGTWRERVHAATPLGRLGRPQEVANLFLFLGSDESSFVTGATFVVDGGMTAGVAGGLG